MKLFLAFPHLIDELEGITGILVLCKQRGQEREKREKTGDQQPRRKMKNIRGRPIGPGDDLHLV
jgi:hypothetical protein